MVKNVTYKPLTLEQQKKANKLNNPLIILFMQTGARIMEVKRIIDYWDGKSNTVEIKVKKSGEKKSRILLTNDVMKVLPVIIKDLRGLTVRTLTRRVDALSDQLGFKFTAHNLRATFATNLMSNGVDIVTVQHLMNHSDVSITARYIQFNEQKLRIGLETLSDKNTLMGMTPFEMKAEILRQRKLITRLEGKINDTKIQ